MKRSEKAVVIENLKARSEKAIITVVSDFKRMPVEEMTNLRVKLRESGNDLVVVKNTLARIAFTGGAHDSVKDMFRENCVVAMGYEDPVAAAKVMTEFAKTSKTLVIRHGSLEGQALTKQQLEDLAKLPSKPELLAKALGTMNAVPTNFVSLFANMLRPMLYVLKAIEEQKKTAA